MAPIIPYVDNANTLAAKPVPGSQQPGFSAIYRNALAEQVPSYMVPAALFQEAVRAVGSSRFIGRRPWDFAKGQLANHFAWQTYAEADVQVQQLGSALTHWAAVGELGQSLPSDFTVALWAPNTPEFQLIFQQSVAFGRRLVCIYDSFALDNVFYVLSHSESRVLFTTSAHLPQLLARKSELPDLKAVVLIDEQPPAGLAAPKLPATQLSRNEVAAAWAKESGTKLLTFVDALAVGQNKLVPYPPHPKPDQIAMYCYTSGTTGQPKGAIVSHAQLGYGAAAQTHVYPAAKSGDSMFSYLPVAHIFEVLLEMVCIQAKAHIGYTCGDTTKILEDLQLLKPSVFPSVPRVLNRIAAQIEMQMSGDSFRSKLLRRAVESKLAYHDVDGQVSHAFWDKLIFRKVRALLGGNVELIISGSAPIRPDVLKLLRVCLVADVREGYGATENMATVTLNLPWDKHVGSVGGPVPGVELRLRDQPELGYTSHDQPYPRGEILVRGPSVFPGYHKDDEKTAESFLEDGWLTTGDIGVIDGRGRLSIVDRVKHLVKLSQGEYIALEKVEAVYAAWPVFQQLIVLADSLQNHIVAVGIADPETFPAFASKVLRKPVSAAQLEQVVQDPAVVRAALGELVARGKQASLSGVEMLKGLHIATQPLSVEEGTLTPTFKYRRDTIKKRFEKEVADLYAQGPMTP